jgi:hypothetical protein
MIFDPKIDDIMQHKSSFTIHAETKLSHAILEERSLGHWHYSAYFKPSGTIEQGWRPTLRGAKEAARQALLVPFTKHQPNPPKRIRWIKQFAKLDA